MSLDSVLRSHLVASADAIDADPESGLRAVNAAVTAKRRRAALAFACAVAACAAVAFWSEAPDVRRPGPPPARENEERVPPPEVDRREGSLPRLERGVRERVGGAGRGPAFARGGIRDTPPAARPVRPDAEGDRHVPHAEGAAAVPPARGRWTVYPWEYGNLMGTHVGENAGLGCWDGEGATGANDCFALDVADDQNRMEIGVVDDLGRSAFAKVYMHGPGDQDSVDLGGICGRTSPPLVVRPGARLSLYIRSNADCSSRQPTTGELRVRFWGE